MARSVGDPEMIASVNVWTSLAIIFGIFGGLGFLLILGGTIAGMADGRINIPGRKGRAQWELEKENVEAQKAAVRERKALHEARTELMQLDNPEKKKEAVENVQAQYEREKRGY